MSLKATYIIDVATALGWRKAERAYYMQTITKEMKNVLDDYFQEKEFVLGNYPIPYRGFIGNTEIKISRSEIETEIKSGQLDTHQAVLDSILELREKGKITSNYFPWIKQRAREIVSKMELIEIKENK